MNEDTGWIHTGSVFSCVRIVVVVAEQAVTEACRHDNFNNFIHS